MNKRDGFRLLEIALLTVVVLFVTSSKGALAAGFAYDKLNRLVSATYKNGVRIEYSYDGVGNRTAKVVSVEALARLSLGAGWNLVGISHQPIDPSCASIFSDVAVGSIWGWDGWKNRVVSTVEPLRAYWVAAAAPADVQYEYVPVSDTTLDLSAPWNVFAVSAETPLPLSYPDVVGSVWGWDGTKYVRVETTLQPHTGYWVAVDTVPTSPPFPLPDPPGDVLLSLELNTQLAGVERESLDLGLLDNGGSDVLEPMPPASPDGFICYILGGGSPPFKCVAKRLSVLDDDAVRCSWHVVAHVPAGKEYTLSWDSLHVPEFVFMTIAQADMRDGMPVGGALPMSETQSVSCLASDAAVFAWRIEATCRARPAEDSDGDLIHDHWERVNFGSIACEPSGDPDGDGMTNYAEFMAGTNPNDSLSSLSVSYVQRHPADESILLAWTSVLGRKYQVLYCDILGGEWHCLGTELPGTGEIILVQEALPPNPVHRFYKIRAW